MHCALFSGALSVDSCTRDVPQKCIVTGLYLLKWKSTFLKNVISWEKKTIKHLENIRVLSHEWSDQVSLSVFQVDVMGSSVLVYGQSRASIHIHLPPSPSLSIFFRLPAGYLLVVCLQYWIGPQDGAMVNLQFCRNLKIVHFNKTCHHSSVQGQEADASWETERRSQLLEHMLD